MTSGPSPCVLDTSHTDPDSIVVLWSQPGHHPSSADMKITIDTVAVSKEDVKAALWMLPRLCSRRRPIAYVKWHRLRHKSAIFGLYDALEAHGVESGQHTKRGYVQYVCCCCPMTDDPTARRGRVCVRGSA